MVFFREGHAEKLVKDCKTVQKADLDHMVIQGSASEHFEAGYCIGLVSGVVDSESLNGVTQQKRFCVPIPDVTGTQLAKVVAKYGDDHPEELHLPSIYLVIRALQTAFPCK